MFGISAPNDRGAPPYAVPLHSLSYDSLETPSSRGQDLRPQGTNLSGSTSAYSMDEAAGPSPKPPNKWVTRFTGLPGVICGVVVGIVLGCILNEATDLPEVAVTWIGTPGRLFVRAVECLVPPLIFCGLVVSMADMSLIGTASNIGGRTLALYLLTTAFATTEGLGMALIFRSAFHVKSLVANETAAAVAIECGDNPGFYLTWADNGTVACQYHAELNSSGSSDNYSAFSNTASLFLQRDLNGTYERTDDAYADLTLTEALMTQLNALVPENITMALAEGTLLSIIMFAIPFGMVLARRNLHHATDVLRDLNFAFMELIGWVIRLTPVAICSLLAAAIAGSEDLGELFQGVAVYCACDICGLIVHVCIFYPVLLRSFVNTNPYKWMAKMARAQLFALGCASSAATLPVVMECIDATRIISQQLYRFILSLGSTIGMDGTAVGTPIAIVFMAKVSDVNIEAVDYFVIWLASAIGAVGVGPVPSAGIVMIMTVWKTVFPNEDLPAAFAFIPATDWFLDRLHTAVNVTCDTIVCRIVAEQVGETTKYNATDRSTPESTV